MLNNEEVELLESSTAALGSIAEGVRTMAGDGFDPQGRGVIEVGFVKLIAATERIAHALETIVEKQYNVTKRKGA